MRSLRPPRSRSTPRATAASVSSTNSTRSRPRPGPRAGGMRSGSVEGHGVRGPEDRVATDRPADRNGASTGAADAERSAAGAPRRRRERKPDDRTRGRAGASAPRRTPCPATSVRGGRAGGIRARRSATCSAPGPGSAGRAPGGARRVHRLAGLVDRRRRRERTALHRDAGTGSGLAAAHRRDRHRELAARAVALGRVLDEDRLDQLPGRAAGTVSGSGGGCSRTCIIATATALSARNGRCPARHS